MMGRGDGKVKGKLGRKERDRRFGRILEKGGGAASGRGTIRDAPEWRIGADLEDGGAMSWWPDRDRRAM
jgi:hypothetical protein